MAMKSAVHKFNLTLSVINKTGESEIWDEALKSVAIKKNYESNVFPLYVLYLRLTEVQKEYIISNNVDVSLKIYRVPEESANESSDEETHDTPVTDKLITDIILKVYDKPTVYITPATSEVDTELTENIKQEFTDYKLTCIPKYAIELNKDIINTVYANANMNEIILNSIHEHYSGDVYYQESTNTDRYDTLLIPPTSLMQELKYLSAYYGIYNKSFNVFCDDSKIYVYDIMEYDRIFNNSFDISITSGSSDSENSELYTSIFLDDETGNVSKNMIQQPPILTANDIAQDTIGSNVMYGYYDDKMNLAYSSYQPGSGSVEKQRVYWRTGTNQNLDNKILYTFRKMIPMTIRNFDTSIINPDTHINIIGSQLSENDGEYSLLSETIYYSTEDFKTYKNAIELMLGKL